MFNFHVVSGRVAEVHRFINVPLRWTEEFPARERRELWIATTCGREIKLVVHSRQMPARHGHQVHALLRDGQLVALHNDTTGGEVNYVRADPPLLFRRIDVAWLMLLCLASLVSFVLGSILVPTVGLVTAAVGMPSVVIARWIGRTSLGIRVDHALERVRMTFAVRPALRRVK